MLAVVIVHLADWRLRQSFRDIPSKLTTSMSQCPKINPCLTVSDPGKQQSQDSKTSYLQDLSCVVRARPVKICMRWVICPRKVRFLRFCIFLLYAVTQNAKLCVIKLVIQQKLYRKQLLIRRSLQTSPLAYACWPFQEVSVINFFFFSLDSNIFY